MTCLSFLFRLPAHLKGIDLRGLAQQFAFPQSLFPFFCNIKMMPRILALNNGPRFENNWVCGEFRREQIDLLCHCLFQWGEGDRLVWLFTHNPALLGPESPHSSTVLKAYLFALYHEGQYDAMFQEMTKNCFEQSHHEELKELWFAARYKEEQRRKDKELVPVDKYRIRKKHPPPRSIFDGEEEKYKFKKKDRKFLMDFYECNKYPAAEDKREIARRTGLNMTQIANWFKNRRQREKCSDTGSGSC